MTPYSRPASLPETLFLLAQGQPLLLAGGTDVYPATQAQWLTRPVIDISAVPELHGITRGPDGLRIGAGTTWAAIAAAALPPACNALQQAAQEVGGRQIQNAGTIGGNLCNASPAADGVPPLLVLDAVIELASPRGLRRVALADFLTGPRQTLRAADEVMVAVIVPDAALSGASHFVKLGARAYLVISIAMVAVRLLVVAGRVQQAALAVGACSAVARRLPGAEQALLGLAPQETAAAIDAAQVAAALAPLDDLRATAVYRAEAAAELLRRALATLAQDHAG
ncbi:FAD binding domain-containing protein [Fertoebacter nigrum]|uniref:FAD binding domain-containing protein n=1 Tax=Fertoeibacter niger TaxID=2656921 RepID=A0A8X8H1U5_9RHOB|nr:FAD binding domain-containing protein [Fertoeibacter niger]NUB45686.1 FAD binding domain-containing protein [Fertoeibacter niger]